ncbi:MAG: tetratricopeptide repeat protein [Gemmatimonadales bacterium]|nr:tetratricopeptide repeat protein [Gemmatimonadales bacterium]
MYRVLTAASLFILVLSLLLVAGCKDGEPLTDLEQFLARTEVLSGEALDDTLRTLAAGSPPYSVFANYVIGNRFYMAAGDSALAVGWDGGTVAALLDSAETYFTYCVEQDSTFIEALVNLGSLWDDRAQVMSARSQRDQKLDIARSFYEKALVVDPTDEKALCNLGSLHLAQRKTGQALKYFQKVLDHNPDSALAHYNMAIMFAEAKIYREAIHEWELAAKCDPNGDIGGRSRDNIKIVNDLMNSPDPDLTK